MKKYFYIITILGGMFLALMVPAPAWAFPDTNNYWARPQIDHLYCRGLVNGYPDGYYRPEGLISRQEFTVILVDAINKKTEALQLQKGQATFKDDVSVWGKGYIELARELNVVAGDDDDCFNPENKISREEAVAMLVNCLGGASGKTSACTYSDVSEISSWALNDVAYAGQIGLTTGYPDGSFHPRQNITRAEAAALFEQFLEYEGDRFRFYGTLNNINLSLRQATVNIDGKDQTFSLASMVYFYKKGSLQPVTELKLPAQAYFDVNDSGKLDYVMMSDTYDNTKVYFTITRLPAADSAQSTGAAGTLAQYTDNSAESGSGKDILNQPGVSLSISGSAMKADTFKEKVGASGYGELVAVIDSGVDPGHPDLQNTGEGFKKIIDFIDLTDEGLVKLGMTAASGSKVLSVDGRDVDVSGIVNCGPVFRYGFIDKSRLPQQIESILPSNQILVVATASKYYDKYDTLYIDTNADGNIKDEKPIKVYSDSSQVGTIAGPENKTFDFVVSKIAADGQSAELGFDSLGHGTEVAGIVGANGTIKGIAPDAQLLPIKIMDGKGQASLQNLESAMQIAAGRGAKIAVMSMGEYHLTASEQTSLATLAGSLWNKYGILFCVAAGNDGPGVGTVADTAAIKNLVGVGAYATPEMWKYNYGYKVNEDTLFDFSSVGPGEDGSTAPLLVAPGCAVSTYPLWSQPYRLDSGTSMAAPHVAGAAALLMDAAQHKLFRDNPRSVWMALLGGARPLDNFEPVEQGYGAVDLMQAWNEIQNLKNDSLAYTTSEYCPSFGYGSGFYSRSLAPGEMSLTISNNSSQGSTLAVGGLSSWIKPQQYSVQVPAGGKRVIDLLYGDLTQPGLYSDFLVADDAATPGWDIAALQAVVVPYKLTGSGYDDSQELGAGEYKRYFFQVPEGATDFSLNLSVGDKGRARMYVISPSGLEDISSYAGRKETAANAALDYSQPQAGTWEVVVSSLPDLSNYDLDSTAYDLSASLQTGTAPVLTPTNRYLVSAVPRESDSSGETYITLHFWDPLTKLPASGIVAIDNKLYEIKNGLVQLERVIKDGIVNLNLQW